MPNNKTVSLRLDDIREGANVGVARVICDPDIIGVLTQVRRTMDEDELEQLADSISDTGQLHPGIVAVLPPQEALQYITEINELWHTNHTLGDYVQVFLDGTAYYLFLVAGHRRHRAVRKLLARPKDTLDLGVRFRGGYFAELRIGLTVAEAIRIQFQENIGTPPPPHEQAEAAWDYWRWRLARESGLTYARFARDIGHNPDWFHKARRFCSLPPHIQEYAWGRGGIVLPFGMLVHLARLAEEWPSFSSDAPMPHEEMEGWLRRHGILPNKGAKYFGDVVDRFLEARRLESKGQFVLFGNGGNMLPGATEVTTREVRSVVEPELTRTMYLALDWLRRVLLLVEAGKLGKDELGANKPYSPSSPARLVSRQISMLQDLLPQLVESLKHEPRLAALAERLVVHRGDLELLSQMVPTGEAAE